MTAPSYTCNKMLVWIFIDNTSTMSHSPSQTSLSSMDGSSTSISRRKSKERKESKSGTVSNNKKGGKRRITKEDIGKPENFQ